MYPILDIGGNKTAVLIEDNFFEALFRTYYRYCSKMLERRYITTL